VIALKQFFNLCRGSGLKGVCSLKISSISPGERTFQFQIKQKILQIIRVARFSLCLNKNLFPTSSFLQ
jgi:hypothetical protein